MADAPVTSQQAVGPTLAAFLALDKDKRRTILARVHTLFTQKSQSWQVLLDAYEGAGGFEDGSYLWKFPREEENEYKSRKEQARYHNYAKSLVNLYVRHVFHKPIDRKTEDQALRDWWQNVDGSGTPMTDFLKRVAHLALAIGHNGVLADKTPELPQGPSRADERGRVVLSVWTPLAIRDWRSTRDELTFLKLREAVQSPEMLADVEEKDKAQYLIWHAQDGWVRVDENGELVASPGSQGNANLGLVPFAVLRPEASAAHPFLGQSLLGNANVFRALFNRCSELDEALRNSAFSMLTVSVDKDGNVEEVKTQVGTEVGSTRAIIAKGTITYATPDQGVPESIRKEIEHLVTEIYRIAHVASQRDSRDAESAEAIRLKHTELNEMLTGLSNALMGIEQQLVRFFYAWTSASPETAKLALDAAKVSIGYPREFFVRELMADLEAWAEAIALDLGETMTQRIKLRAAKAVDPDMDEKTLQQVEQEIKAQKAPEPTPSADDVRARAIGRMAAGGQQPPPEA